jgi:hypothetical protein
MSKNLTKSAKPGRKDAPAGTAAKAVGGDWLVDSGIDSWAASLGSSAPAVLAATAAILTGTGAGGWFARTWGQQPLPKHDLIVPDLLGRTGRCITMLTAPALYLNQRLTEQAAGYSPAVFDHLAFGTFADSQQTRQGASTVTGTALARHRQALDQDDERPFLITDLGQDTGQCRREAIIRPTFLLAGPRASDLRTLTDECHKRTALVVQMRFPTCLRNHKSLRDILEVAELLDGLLHRIRPARPGIRVEPPGVTKVHAILHPDRADYEALADLAPELLDRCLLVDEQPGSQQSENHTGCRFFAAYKQALFQILELRREGQLPLFAFENPESASVFERELWSFENECDNLPAEPGVSARGLPLCLIWAMGFLRPHLPPAPGLADGRMICAAFDVSRHLLAGHVRACRSLRAAGMVAERLKLAEKIVCEVKDHAPLKPRDLMRSFSRQRKERFDPVIEALIGLSVLGRDKDHLLVSGPVEFQKARRELEMQFADTLCADEEEKKTTVVEEKKKRVCRLEVAHGVVEKSRPKKRQQRHAKGGVVADNADNADNADSVQGENRATD